MSNIYPVFEKIIPRKLKEERLNQKALVIWLTGLSGSGKTTLATALEQELFQRNFLTQILDGDNIRAGINNNLGFSNEDRIENIRRIAEVAKLFLNGGIITLCAFVSPTEEIRHMVKSIVGYENFFEIYISTPLGVCEQRDVKGLYAKARAGLILDFTGVNAPFEEPVDADLVLNTTSPTIQESMQTILDEIMPRITFSNK